MYPPFDIRQLYYFVTTAEEGQITRAAAKLHVAQPALSQAIAKLEATADVKLFERHSRGVNLTPAGAAFFEKARLAVTAVQEAADVLGPWVRAESAVVLGFSPSFHPIARPIMRRLMEENPDVQVRVRHLHPANRLVDLKGGLIDAELMLPPPPADPDLVVATVFRSPRYVLLPDSHPLSGEAAIRFDEIANETFPGRHPSVSEEWCAEAWLSDRRGHDPPVTTETPLTLDEVWALVSTGKAVSVLPGFMVPPIEGHGVRAIPLSDVEPIAIGLARRRDDTRAVVGALFDVALDLVAKHDEEVARALRAPEVSVQPMP
jgi:DNA-binding transcriptional LysR family regulator